VNGTANVVSQARGALEGVVVRMPTHLSKRELEAQSLASLVDQIRRERYLG
jgi:hypothetical protein